MKHQEPKLSVITCSFNTGRFLRDTMDSIQEQSYQDFEHIVVDGASTDSTLETLKDYPGINLISEPDNGYLEAFWKGLRMAKGKYVTQCAVSDGYLDKDWYRKAVDVLDKDKEASLVWGFPQYLYQDGRLGKLPYPQFHNRDPKQKTNFIYYWLQTAFWFPEGNFVVRKVVMEECFPEFNTRTVQAIEPWLDFNYAFNSKGYLPYFVRTIANYGRIHDDQLGERESKSGVGDVKFKNYLHKVGLYGGKLLSGRKKHIFRDGNSRQMSIQLSRLKIIALAIFLPRWIFNIILRPTFKPILGKNNFTRSKRIYEKLQ